MKITAAEKKLIKSLKHFNEKLSNFTNMLLSSDVYKDNKNVKELNNIVSSFVIDISEFDSTDMYVCWRTADGKLLYHRQGIACPALPLNERSLIYNLMLYKAELNSSLNFLNDSTWHSDVKKIKENLHNIIYTYAHN